MNETTIGAVCKALEKSYAPRLAEDWDNVGLLLGNSKAKVTNILTTLDVTDAVVDEAIACGANLIVAHHPLIFKGLKSLTQQTPLETLVCKLIKHDIAVFAAHTNLDTADNGLNDWLAEELQLGETSLLVPTKKEAFEKVVVYVPATHVEVVSDALHRSGAGIQGDYSDCAFYTEGIGTFRPLEGSNPFIGETGEVARIEEVRLEMLVHPSVRPAAIAAMIAAHPYEEVAYDVFPVSNVEVKNGYGRVGRLPQPMTLLAFSAFVSEKLGTAGARFVGTPDRMISKVAILGGSGDSFWRYALSKNADVYVSGDISYHHALDALAEGLSIVDPGHYMENIAKHGLVKELQLFQSDYQWNYEVFASKVNTEPFSFVHKS
ncbi:MAG: Nif3-like dinuclear metal center hexameric protein [Bacilli bacterium]